MKKKLPQYNPDGSRYYGNGVWGPSTADESEFYENLSTLEKMLASFKFLK